MNLYMIADDGRYRTGLVVAAETPQAAYRLWCAWFSEWDTPHSVMVYELPKPVVSCAYDWSALPCTQFNKAGT